MMPPAQHHNNSDVGGDKSSERPQSKLETKAENKERAEAAKEIADGTLNKDISANTIEQRKSRKSNATKYGVPSADSLLPERKERFVEAGSPITVRGREYKLDELTAQNQNIVSDATQQEQADVKLARQAQVEQNYPKDIARQLKDALHGKPHPLPDGQDIFTFTNKRGAQDAARSSDSFAQTVNDLQQVKWAKELHVIVHHPVKFTDYSAEHSLIEIDSKDSPRRQAEVFGHEGYHATHQDLDKLYGGEKPLSESDYVQVKMKQEQGAFLREIMINEELRRTRPEFGNTPIEFRWVDSSDPKGEPKTQVMNDLLIRKDGHIDEQASMKNIGDFLKMHSAARKDGSGAWIRNPDGTLLQDNYEKHYRDGYQKYKDSKNYHDSQVILRAKHYI